VSISGSAGSGGLKKYQVRPRGLLNLESRLQVQRGIDPGIHVQQPGEQVTTSHPVHSSSRVDWRLL